MPWIAINRISVDAPADADRLIEAFRHRSGQVDRSPGFVAFHAWREEEGREVLILTSWQRREDFRAWTESEAFRSAHRNAAGAPGRGDARLYEELL